VQLMSLGLAVPYWAKAHFPDLPSVGRFEFATFDPERWVPEYPNPAFLNRLPDDEFWAAKQIMSLGNEQIRAIVETGQYSDPTAADWLAQCLIQRRDKIGRAFYKKVLPIDKFEIRDNQLVFEDLSEKADFGAAGPYRIQWFQFDNGTEATSPIPGATTAVMPSPSGPYLVARIASESRPRQLVDVTVRLEGSSSPTVVGIDRQW